MLPTVQKSRRAAPAASPAGTPHDAVGTRISDRVSHQPANYRRAVGPVVNHIRNEPMQHCSGSQSVRPTGTIYQEIENYLDIQCGGTNRALVSKFPLPLYAISFILTSVPYNDVTLVLENVLS